LPTIDFVGLTVTAFFCVFVRRVDLTDAFYKLEEGIVSAKETARALITHEETRF